MTDPWYQRAFEKGYLDLYAHRDQDAARREIRGLVDRGLRGPLLDLGCGFGRHSLAFADAGLRVVGLDLSLDLLTQARHLAGAESLAGRLLRADFRALPFGPEAFESVVMLFSSFGYFDDRANADVLAGIGRTLRPGGCLLLDLMNARRIRSTLVPESRSERGGRLLEERRVLTDGGRRVRKDVSLTEPDGSQRSWYEDVRLYEVAEMKALLGDRGFVLERVEGDFDGRAVSDEAPRCILWARKAADPGARVG